MFALEVETVFCAAHAIVIAGARERRHGHNFRVRVVVAGEALDSEGLLCDFHAVEGWVASIIAPFRDGDLNETPPFDRRNPTAERIAEHIGDSLAPRLPASVWVESVSVTEAPGCVATYRPARRVKPVRAARPTKKRTR